MTIYRFAVHPADDGLHHLQCITDPSLFTQARDLNEALQMARDVVAAVDDDIDPAMIQIELVLPPDVALTPTTSADAA